MLANTDCILFGDDCILLLVHGRPVDSCLIGVVFVEAFEGNEDIDSVMLTVLSLVFSWVNVLSKFESHRMLQFLLGSGVALQ